MASQNPDSPGGRQAENRSSAAEVKAALVLVEAVSSEVVRKLRLAAAADTRDDREIVCEEVFCDVTGMLDEKSQAKLGVAGPVPFYSVLANHYASQRGGDTAVAVLHLLQGLYGQGYAAPLVALLLHRWLLCRRSVGRGLPEEQRTRLANVLCLGAAQLFLGDVHGGAHAFQPLWHCLCYEVILGQEMDGWATHTLPTRHSGAGSSDPSPLSPQHLSNGRGSPPLPVHVDSPSGSLAANSSGAGGLATLPATQRGALLSAVASFLPYYAPVSDLEDLLRLFPGPTALPAPALPSPALGDPSAPHHTSAPAARPNAEDGSRGANTAGIPQLSGRPCSPALVSPPYEGVDFILLQVVDMLSRVRSEAGLVHYLTALAQLGAQHSTLHGPHGMRLATRLRLQGALYALSSPGGPHYPPKAVRGAALVALDRLFPAGRSTRNLVRMLFRLLHPNDWLGEAVSWPMSALRAACARLVVACFYALHSLVVWRRWRGDTDSDDQGADGSAAGNEDVVQPPADARRDGGGVTGKPGRGTQAEGQAGEDGDDSRGAGGTVVTATSSASGRGWSAAGLWRRGGVATTTQRPCTGDDAGVQCPAGSSTTPLLGGGAGVSEDSLPDSAAGKAGWRLGSMWKRRTSQDQPIQTHQHIARPGDGCGQGELGPHHAASPPPPATQLASGAPVEGEPHDTVQGCACGKAEGAGSVKNPVEPRMSSDTPTARTWGAASQQLISNAWQHASASVGAGVRAGVSAMGAGVRAVGELGKGAGDQVEGGSAESEIARDDKT